MEHSEVRLTRRPHKQNLQAIAGRPLVLGRLDVTDGGEEVVCKGRVDRDIQPEV